MLTLTVEETVTHGGHYYVAIAQNAAMLPPAPGGTDPVNCNGLAPTMNPQLPILADGLFPQITPASGPQTVQVQLPAGMECPNCVVQVVQYMTNHAQPCFYYHCANVHVSNTQPMPPDAGVMPGQEAGPGPGPGPDETTAGCCSAQGGRANSLLLALAVGLLVFRRRRR
jgi:MYXO-CTERM domain-containing protein